MHFFVTRVGALLLGLASALILAELVLRLAGPSLASPRLPLNYDEEAIDGFASARFRLILDPTLGWTTKPAVSFSAAEEPGVVYRHNDDGLRADRDYAPYSASGVVRLAAFGDSFTYCEEVNFGDCWTRRLELVLPSTEVPNYGVPGFGPDQAWLRYQQTEWLGEPCAVLIGYSVENIIRVINRFRPFMHPATSTPLAKPRFVLDGQELVLLPNPARVVEQLKDPLWVEANLGPHDDWYFPGMFVRNPFDRFELVRLVRTVFYRARQDSPRWTLSAAERMYRPDSAALELLSTLLVEFAGQVRSRGATPVVLVFPTRVEIDEQRDGGGKPHAALIETLRDRGVSSIDLTDALSAEARRSRTGRLLARGEHFNPVGNAIVAQTLASRLPALTATTCVRR